MRKTRTRSRDSSNTSRISLPLNPGYILGLVQFDSYSRPEYFYEKPSFAIKKERHNRDACVRQIARFCLYYQEITGTFPSQRPQVSGAHIVNNNDLQWPVR